MIEPVAQKPPLLSVCIPTYNRAQWLRTSLRLLTPLIAQAGDLVEVVISDNASDDETAEVVREAASLMPIRYHRNDENIGFMRNIQSLPTDLAQGEFVWLLGDDDLVCEGAIAQILSTLKQHPDIDYLYVNHSTWQPREAPSASLSPSDVAGLGQPRNSDLFDRQVSELAELIPGDPNCFTPIYCSVIRRQLAAESYDGCANDIPFSTIESVFPHAKYIAENLIHKPALYIGQPCALASAHTTWGNFWPITVLYLYPLLFDCLERNGVSRSVINQHRRFMLRYSASPLSRLLTNPDLPLRSQFSLGHFLWRHRRLPECRTIILPVCLSYWKGCFPKPVRRMLGGIWSVVRSCKMLIAANRSRAARPSG